MKLVGSGQYNTASQTLSLDRFDLTSADKLSLSVQGSLVEPIGSCKLDIQGRVTYDLAKLLQQLAPQWNARVQVTGQDTQQFVLRGPLFNVPVDPAAAERPGRWCRSARMPRHHRAAWSQTNCLDKRLCGGNRPTCWGSPPAQEQSRPDSMPEQST